MYGDKSTIENTPEYKDWVRKFGDACTQCSTVEEAYSAGSPGLFSTPPNVIITCEKFKASEIREISMHAQENGISVLLCSSKKPQGKFDGFNVEIIGAKSTTGHQWLVDKYNIGSKAARVITQRTNSPQSAAALSQQVSLLGGRMPTKREFAYLYDPFKGDMPPWDITNSIQSGKPHDAVRFSKLFLQQKSATPQSLCMQLTGFYRKVLTERGNWFFTEKRKLLKDHRGMVNDMGTYPMMILSSGKNNYLLYAYVASLSSRFSKRGR